MIEALLLDLDNTLLHSSFETFLPAYLKAIGGYLGDVADPDEVVAQLMVGTERMLGNLDPTRTLKAAFDAHFYPALGRTEEELRSQIEKFYQDSYPDLQELTGPMPGASEFVSYAMKRGLRLAVTTNPLFPRSAINQRLAWGGLDPADGTFELVTTYEDFHFAKPNPAYFAEVLGMLGVGPGSAALIGDDPERDIQPASVLGISTRLFSPPPKSEAAQGDPFESIRDWLEGLSESPQPHEPRAASEAVLARMRGFLGALLQLAPPFDDPRWRERPGRRDWAPVEVLCHLRDTELEVNRPRLQRLTKESTPFLPAENPDQWADARDYLRQDPAQALGAYRDARLETIAQLATLDDQAWEAPGRHALLGPQTLAEVMLVATDHDLVHLNQLRQTLEALDDGA